MLKKIWNNKWIIRGLLKTIYFNFHYLPLRQAIRLPIILYRPRLLKCKGNIKIEGNVKTGMIKLGLNNVPIYPNTGIIFENHGGDIIFKGHCFIGNNSSISVGKNAKLVIGNNFNASTSLKLISYYNIVFKDNVLCGWECLFMDTDFHQLTLINNIEKPKAYNSIIIGNNNWFALKCTIMKGTILSDNNVIAANSLLNRNYHDNSYCLFAGIPAIIKRRGIYRDNLNDIVIYN